MTTVNLTPGEILALADASRRGGLEQQADVLLDTTVSVQFSTDDLVAVASAAEEHLNGMDETATALLKLIRVQAREMVNNSRPRMQPPKEGT